MEHLQIHSMRPEHPNTHSRQSHYKKTTDQYLSWAQIQKSSTKYKEIESNNILKELYITTKWDLFQAYKISPLKNQLMYSITSTD